MPQRSTLIRQFYPALDGLRAVAFLLVFMTHYGVMTWNTPIWKWGWAGVDLFFVLSGFLITGILYDSLHRPDFFRNFYIRRALRIFPIFYGTWLLVLLLTPVLHVVWNRYNLATMAYVGNFFIPGFVLGQHPDPLAVGLFSQRHQALRYLDFGPVWSLCVEEQFYILWPAIVWMVRSRLHLLRVCLAIIVVVPIIRSICILNYPKMLASQAIYTGSWPRVDTLLFGAALALWLRGPAPSTETLRRAAYGILVAAPLALVFCMRAPHHHISPVAFDPIVDSIGFSLIALSASAILLLAIDPSTTLCRWLKFRPLAYLGRISYGLYFFHGIPANYLAAKSSDLARHHLAFLVPLGAFVYALLASILSFRYLESPFLRLKSRLAPRPNAVEDPQPVPANATS